MCADSGAFTVRGPCTSRLRQGRQRKDTEASVQWKFRGYYGKVGSSSPCSKEQAGAGGGGIICTGQKCKKGTQGSIVVAAASHINFNFVQEYGEKSIFKPCTGYSKSK